MPDNDLGPPEKERPGDHHSARPNQQLAANTTDAHDNTYTNAAKCTCGGKWVSPRTVRHHTARPAPAQDFKHTVNTAKVYAARLLLASVADDDDAANAVIREAVDGDLEVVGIMLAELAIEVHNLRLLYFDEDDDIIGRAEYDLAVAERNMYRHVAGADDE
jgi:hypothetical protein